MTIESSPAADALAPRTSAARLVGAGKLLAADTGLITIGRPALRVAIVGDAAAAELPIVVRRPTLREAQRTRSLLRAGTRDTANFSVALAVEVAIAPHPASARASAAAVASTTPTGVDTLLRHGAGTSPGGASETVRYVGTPHGLVTLIRDIYAAEVADAVLIVPIDGSATEHRVRAEVLPQLQSRRAA